MTENVGGYDLVQPAFDTYIFDMDGVLWRGRNTLSGSPEFVRTLVAAGKKVLFATNNSLEGPQFYVNKLKARGFGGRPRVVAEITSFRLSTLLDSLSVGCGATRVEVTEY